MVFNFIGKKFYLSLLYLMGVWLSLIYAGPTLHTKGWIRPDSNQHRLFPEQIQDGFIKEWLGNKTDMGIAICGGGIRAATLTLGWLEAFHELGYLETCKYVVVNSGSSWVTIPIVWGMAEGKDAKDLFKIMRECLKTSKFSLTDVDPSKLDNFWDKGKFYWNQFWNAVLHFKINVKWTELVSSNFFKRFNYQNKLYEDGAKWLNEQNVGLKQEQKAPFLIVEGSVYLDNFKKKIIKNWIPNPFKTKPKPDDEKEDLKGIFVPFEFTPFYCGFPCCLDRFKEIYTILNDNITISNMEGFLNCTGFNAERFTSPSDITLPKDTSELDVDVVIGKSTRPTLVDISSISSSALQVGLLNSVGGKKDLTKFLESQSMQFNFIAPSVDHKDGNKVKLIQNKLTFVDGGAYDNTGLISLVRRGVKTIIACIANNVGIDDYQNRLELSDIQSLFGMAKSEEPNDPKDLNGQDSKNFNKIRQIFDEKEWDRLNQTMLQKIRDKKPLVHTMFLKVQPNPYAGVTGGYTTNITFIFNAKWSEFDKTLEPAVSKVSNYSLIPSLENPKDLKAMLFDSMPIDDRFPFYYTYYLNYLPDLAESMSNLAKESVLYHCRHLLEQII